MQQTGKDDRREYEKPELREFGTIAELTAANAIGGKNDAGTQGKDKSA
jgi:hypothetical protein